jgi:N-acetyltransferase
VILTGERVRLELLDEAAHSAGLADSIHDGELWKIPVTLVPHPDDLGGFFADAAAGYAAGELLPFAVIDLPSGRIAGATRFLDMRLDHRRAEIGFTFYGAGFQRTYVNTEVKLLMLEYAFETLALNRVALLTDELNKRSRAAIERLGARPEGILRSHMVMPDGRIRDSALYSIVRGEWPGVRDDLQARLRASYT